MNKDLTVGNPSKVLWKFCMPLFGSVLFQQLYNIADSFVAGNFISEDALASVGNSYEITLIFLAFAFGCNMGCSINVSMFFGSKRFTDMKTAVYTSIISSAVTCCVLMIIGLLLGGAILGLIDTPDEIFADSHLYLNIYVLGLPFIFFYNVSNGIFSALGDSKTPFVFLACSSIANIGMDILFVAGLGMRIEGVAWATFICQGVSCVLALATVFRRLSKFECDEKPRIFDQSIFIRFLKIAVPTTLQQSFISLGNIAVQRIVNGYGTAVIAGHSAAIKLNSLVLTSFNTISTGISNFTAQNLGAKRHERVRDGLKAGIKMLWLISIPLVTLYFLLGNHFLGFFLNEPSVDAINSGFALLKILSPFYFIIAIKIAVDGILRGAGMMKQFMTVTFVDLALRVALVYLFAWLGFSATTIWWAWPIGWVIATIISVYLHHRNAVRDCAI